MWSNIFNKSLMGKKWQEMSTKTMNCGVNYEDEVKAKIIHPDSLPKVVPLDSQYIQVLKKAGILKRVVVDHHKKPPIFQSDKPPSNHRRSVLGKGRIAECSRKARTVIDCPPASSTMI